MIRKSVTWRATWGILLAMSAPLVMGVRTADDAGRPWRIRPGTVVPFEANGVAGKIRIDPGAQAQMTCNASFAARAEMTDRREARRIDFGGVFKMLHIALVHVVFGKSVSERWTLLADTDFLDDADCEIGPGGFAIPIEFLLSPPIEGENTIQLPMRSDNYRFSDFSYAQLPVGKDIINVRFDMREHENFATANAAQFLASQNGGKLQGPVMPVVIAWDFKRPARRFILGKPLKIGALSIATMNVRVYDWGSILAIDDADAPAEGGGSVDVVVKARKKTRKWAAIRVGSDQLFNCSRILYDNPNARIELTCA